MTCLQSYELCVLWHPVMRGVDPVLTCSLETADDGGDTTDTATDDNDT